MCDGLEFKPHLGGHWDKAHYSRGVLHGARALTSNRMLPHCGFEGLCTLGLRQQRSSTSLRAHAVHTEEVPVRPLAPLAARSSGPVLLQAQCAQPFVAAVGQHSVAG